MKECRELKRERERIFFALFSDFSCGMCFMSVHGNKKHK